MSKLRLNIAKVIVVFAIALVWLVTLTQVSDRAQEQDLLQQAQGYLDEKIYIKAIPLLEEAVSLETSNKYEIEELLKNTYLNFPNQSDYIDKYEDILQAQLSRENVTTEIYIEAAEHYEHYGEIDNMLNILRLGAINSDDASIAALYEEKRYGFDFQSKLYQDVTMATGNSIAVQSMEGLWGIASAAGALHVPCEYEKVSNYYNNLVVVNDGTEIYAVDSNNNRVALADEAVVDFESNLDGYITVNTADGWTLTGTSLNLGNPYYEDVGAFCNGYFAAKQDGKWGVLDSSLEWLLQAEFDEIIMDELGVSVNQDVVFAKKDSAVMLYSDSEAISGPYEEAKAFSISNYAAVKSNGKWGFIDNKGNLVIDYQFDDAQSFSQHLAAVKVGDMWGYISVYGQMAIEPQFLNAKNFSNGSAAVLLEEGWRFITLTEHKEEVKNYDVRY